MVMCSAYSGSVRCDRTGPSRLRRLKQQWSRESDVGLVFRTPCLGTLGRSDKLKRGRAKHISSCVVSDDHASAPKLPWPRSGGQTGPGGQPEALDFSSQGNVALVISRGDTWHASGSQKQKIRLSFCPAKAASGFALSSRFDKGRIPLAECTSSIYPSCCKYPAQVFLKATCSEHFLPLKAAQPNAAQSDIHGGSNNPFKLVRKHIAPGTKSAWCSSPSILMTHARTAVALAVSQLGVFPRCCTWGRAHAGSNSPGLPVIACCR